MKRFRISLTDDAGSRLTAQECDDVVLISFDGDPDQGSTGVVLRRDQAIRLAPFLVAWLDQTLPGH